jgi:hypothetical protein
MVTVSDVWLWIKWAYFWPGDGLIHLAILKAPEIAAFFELTPAAYGGPLSLFLSFPMWILALAIFIVTWRMMIRLGERAAEALKRPFQQPKAG